MGKDRRHPEGAKGEREAGPGRERHVTPRSPAGKAPSQRQLRVGEEIRHALSAVFLRGEIRDPVLHDVSITVTEVRVSPDLKHATAFVMPLGGGGARREEILAALTRVAPWIRGQIARAVQLRVSPMVGFRLDTSFDVADEIDAVFRRPEVAADLVAPPAKIPDEE